MTNTIQLLEGLIEETSRGVLAVRLDGVSLEVEASQVQLLWQEKYPSLAFDIEVKSGVFYLLISKKNHLKVAVRYDN